MRLAGICVAMAGIVWYSVLKLSEVTTAARQLLPSTANGSHAQVALASVTSAHLASVVDLTLTLRYSLTAGVTQPTAPVPVWRQGLEWNPNTKDL
jgi:hypothetical protein